MKYKMTKRTNPQDLTKSKLYATPVNNGKITQKNIAADIVNFSSLSRGDVTSVIENLIDTIPKYLLMGKSVKLGELGTFRISFSSTGVDNEAEFTTDKISNVKVLFLPSPELRASLNGIKFEKQK
jgi:predicted histone-like DNA-binding protein